MITKAELIHQPDSGEFNERIYDNESAWNSQHWAFVKFMNEDGAEWCGQFRGFPLQVAVSEVIGLVLILTSDYLYQLDRNSGDLMELEDNHMYKSLTTAPNGDFILADYYRMKKITSGIKQMISIESPLEMDLIQFKEWEGTKLVFTCEEFTNWGKVLKMVYDCEMNRIETLNSPIL